MVALNPLLLFGLAGFSGFNVDKLISFDGEAGQAIDTAEWNVITNVRYNNEVQDYTTSTDNMHHSGNGTLLVIPLRSDSGQWTSGRIESTATYTPQDKKTTRFQSHLRFGDSPQDKQQGIWPAFWTLGGSSREGVPWPECGELDIMERKNGEPTGHGTPHCGPGDSPCGGLTKSVKLADNGWHTWAIEVDRTDGDWKKQTIRWLLDDKEYNKVSGEDMEKEEIWKSVAHSPHYFILNVAVGGNWPGPPNDKTADGLDNALEVKYIAVGSK
ncbi:concanavalin A-like lectin/glucanase domain-containing protein [Chaetomium tenue]|uniref:Concanavalin A-like lectin/glucanase domain-containing protein n=1 Tax=Chaetomium tenue TaxID=1854479 RepID=A0ACB7PTA9_9PEZI|nr:concanavalin A-like lectin/glucanase domain-containing protein [Chaetomium globosum]